MVYYVLALALFMEVGYGEVLRCLVEGLARLGLPVERLRQSAPSSISQARQRLGPEPLKLLYETLVTPIAQEQTQGAFYRLWRLVSVDGSTLDLPDTEENEAAFGRPGRFAGEERVSATALRHVGRERNPHSVWRSSRGVQGVGSATGSGGVGSTPTRHAVPGRSWFFSYQLWQRASKTGAALVWRVKKNLRLPVRQRLSDGSYLSQIYASSRDRRLDWTEEGSGCG